MLRLALPAGIYHCIVFICMVVFNVGYAMTIATAGTYYGVVYVSQIKHVQEKETLGRLQTYFHHCSTNSSCNYVAEDMKNGFYMYNTWSEIPIEKLFEVWMKFRGQYSYMMFAEELSWQDARATCQLYGGDLASITSKEEEEKIKKLLSGFANEEFFWCGLNDIEKEGRYVWSDGSAYNYTNSFTTDPRSVDYKDCILITPSLKWHNYPCNQTEYFICKILV